MFERSITAKIVFCTLDELSDDEKILIKKAKEISENAYAPYSGFKVGAACIIENGEIVTGNNQENAAYPAGICAERTALFYANANFPNQAVKMIAIAAQNKNGFMSDPIAPCGICRQVLLEVEQRYNSNIRVLLYGSKEIAIFEKSSDLLPLCFGVNSL